MSLLSLVQGVCDLVGVASPSAVAGSPDPKIRQMLALLNLGGGIMTRLQDQFGGGWACLEREHAFTTIPGVEAYQFPSDYMRMIGHTCWDATSYEQVRGRLSPQEWRLSRNGIVSPATIYSRFRIRRGLGTDAPTSGPAVTVFRLDPVPTAAFDVVFEYVSQDWVATAGFAGTKVSLTLDSDVPILDQDLCALDLIWRWKKAKGLDFGADLAEFEYERDSRLAAMAGPRNVSLGSRNRSVLSEPSLPEGNFPSGA